MGSYRGRRKGEWDLVQRFRGRKRPEKSHITVGGGLEWGGIWGGAGRGRLGVGGGEGGGGGGGGGAAGGRVGGWGGGGGVWR